MTKANRINYKHVLTGACVEQKSRLVGLKATSAQLIWKSKQIPINQDVSAGQGKTSV